MANRCNIIEPSPYDKIILSAKRPYIAMHNFLSVDSYSRFNSSNQHDYNISSYKNRIEFPLYTELVCFIGTDEYMAIYEVIDNTNYNYNIFPTKTKEIAAWCLKHIKNNTIFASFNNEHGHDENTIMSVNVVYFSKQEDLVAFKLNFEGN